MSKIIIDEKRLAKDLGFTIGGKFQESIFAKNYLKCNALIRVEEDFYNLCLQNRIWEKVIDDDMKKMAYTMFPEEGKYIWCKKYENNYFQAIKMLTKSIDKVNPYSHKINFQDCVYDFKERVHKLRREEEHFTYEMKYSVLEGARDTPVFDKFMRDITCGNKSLKKYLMVVLAYLISGDKKLQKFFILKGNGANGKSTLINLLIKLIGDIFVTSISLKKINDKFILGKAVGKKLIVASENESGGSVSTETVKMLTGGDLVEVEQKYKDPFSAKLSVEILFAVNNTIKFSENSHGLKRRVEVIPFDFTISEEDMDIDLERKLEEEIPGIMGKLIDVHKEFAEAGYKLPECAEVEEAKKEFFNKVPKSLLKSEVFDFLENKIEIDPTKRVSKNDVYKTYLNSGSASCSQTKFWMDFNIWEKYHEYKIGECNNNGRYKTGISFKDNKIEELKNILE